MVENVDEFLAHYGIPGMKWGKRNSYFTTGGKKDTSHLKKALDLPGHRRNPTASQKRQDRIDVLDTGVLGVGGKAASAVLKAKQRDVSTGRSAHRSERKAARKQDEKNIKDARDRQGKRFDKVYEKYNKEYTVAKTERGKEAALEALELAKYKVYQHKDADMASRLTRGEKVSGSILFGAGGLLTAALVASPFIARKIVKG